MVHNTIGKISCAIDSYMTYAQIVVCCNGGEPQQDNSRKSQLVEAMNRLPEPKV